MAATGPDLQVSIAGNFPTSPNSGGNFSVAWSNIGTANITGVTHITLDLPVGLTTGGALMYVTPYDYTFTETVSPDGRHIDAVYTGTIVPGRSGFMKVQVASQDLLPGTITASVANATDGNPANNRVNVAQTGAPLPVPSPQPVPSASGINPSSGPAGGGTTVTVTGSDLTNGLVMFGTTPGTNNSCSATWCTATSPAGAGTVHVAVLTPGGMSPPSSADLFAFQGSPPPAPVPGVTNLSSVSGPAAGGTNMYVLGSNLAGGTVSFGDTPGRNTSCGPDFCSTTSPPGTGTVDVTVTTAGGTSALGPADRFTYGTPTAVLSISTVGGGTVSGAAAGSYPLGSVLTLTANPKVGSALSSWTVDGTAAGSANRYTLTMDRDHRVVATFAPVPTSGPAVALSPSSLAFGSQQVGTTSNPQTITLSNTGAAQLSITKIALGGSNPGQFTRSSACPSTLGVGASCTISVIFKPTSRGSKAAVLSITDNAPNSPQTVALNGRA